MRIEIRGKLRGGSTATLASALNKRGLRHQMMQDVRPLSPSKAGSMVGPPTRSAPSRSVKASTP